jgi:hypothetical protein
MDLWIGNMLYRNIWVVAMVNTVLILSIASIVVFVAFVGWLLFYISKFSKCDECKQRFHERDCLAQGFSGSICNNCLKKRIETPVFPVNGIFGGKKDE